MLIKTGMHPGIWWQGNDYSPQEKSQNIVLTIYIELCSHIPFSAGRGTTKIYQTYYAKFLLCKNYQQVSAGCRKSFSFNALSTFPIAADLSHWPQTEEHMFATSTGFGDKDLIICDISKMQEC